MQVFKDYFYYFFLLKDQPENLSHLTIMKKRFYLNSLLAGWVGVGLLLALCATACNVTRVVTNESQYVQRGDTSVVIQTKTVETYDASRR